jgi:uncharacterized tellurite resistance protein B-like protein
MSFWQWIGLDGAPASREPEGVDRLEHALDGMDPAKARYVACFAYILTRSARADHEVTDGEAREMHRIVAEQGGVSMEVASTLIELARKEALRSGGTEDFIVTREFNRLASREQKLALLDALFAVSGIDESILTVEDNEIRRVANELTLEHADYIAVRARHRDNLAVMQDKSKNAPPR